MTDLVASILLSAVVVVIVVWVSRVNANRRADQIERVSRLIEPGPRYGARKIGTGMVYLGGGLMTFDEAAEYAAEHHPDYEVVGRMIIHTDWEPLDA